MNTAQEFMHHCKRCNARVMHKSISYTHAGVYYIKTMCTGCQSFSIISSPSLFPDIKATKFTRPHGS